MKSPFYFIVKPLNGRRYDSVKEINGTEFITSVSVEDYTVSNRFAEVVSTPIDYKGDIKPGDVLVVHHNVFKYYYDMKGREKSGRSFLKDDLFFVEDNQFYLYKSDEDWKVNGSFCFIEPVKAKESIYTKMNSEEDLTGVIKYIDPKLSKYNLNVGDEVGFTPDSEYEFVIEDQKLYRVRSKNICIKF